MLVVTRTKYMTDWDRVGFGNLGLESVCLEALLDA